MLIDIHVHTCLPRHPKLLRANGTRYPAPERLLRMMDEAGIDKAVVLSGVSPECRYTVVAPEETVAICARHADRLIPFLTVDPRFLANSPEADFGPLLEAYKEMGCRGVGEYVPNIPFDDPLNLNFFRHVERAGLPLTFHVGPRLGGVYGCFDDVGLPRLERVLQQFTDLTFLAHSQPFWAEIGPLTPEDTGGGNVYPQGPIAREGRVVELMRRYPNLHGDLSAGSGYNAISRDPEFGYRFLEEFQDRLYWGTDICNEEQELPIVEYFRKLKEERRISGEAHDKITWRNAARLLGLHA